MTWTNLVLVSFAAAGPLLLAGPVLLFMLEITLAVIFRRQNTRPLVKSPPKTAILIPAHNEGAGIAAMLSALKATLRGKERILVVADNCTDQTADVAREAGAEVLERTDADRRGKGFALAHGIEHLKRRPPEVLVILDADCEVSDDAVARLAHEAQCTNRPVQGLYLCYAPDTNDARSAISAMAFQFKNFIRPLGMSFLGGPSYLTGSGMAIPWKLVQEVPWASGNVVEDMQLGLDYAAAGFPPVFFDGAKIASPLPVDSAAAGKQRTRWEHGHLKTLLQQVPELTAQGLRERRPALLLLALDLAIPPLALFASLGLLTLIVSISFSAISGVWWPAWIAVAECVLFGLSFLAGWFVFCREAVPLRMLLQIPAYIGGKLSIYLRFLKQPEQQWVRTQRSGESV